MDYSDKDILKNFSSYIFEPEKQKSRTVILNHVHAGTQKATNDEAEGDFATKKAFIDAAELDNKKKTKQNQNHFKILEDCFDKMPSVDGKLTHSMKTKCNENTRFISGLRNKNHEKENKDDTVKISTQKGDGFDLFLSLLGSKSKSIIYEKCRVIFRDSPSNSSFDNTLVLMPDDDNNYQKQIDELLNFLSRSHNCFFNAEMPQGMRLKQVGAHEPYYLEADIPTSGKEERIRIRMNVVSREAFENALRDNDIGGLELTYINIFPTNCRMFIAFPTSKGSFLDRKDRLDRM